MYLEYVAEDHVAHSFIIENVKRGNGHFYQMEIVNSKIIIYEEWTWTVDTPIMRLRSFG